MSNCKAEGCCSSPHSPVSPSPEQLYRRALLLAMVTVGYNIAEGLVSIWFGFRDETLSLFGFGVDSFVEVISGIGIWHMIIRIRRSDNESVDRFEKTALRVTGSAFYLLAAGLFVSAALNIYSGEAPRTTFWGVVISLVSVATMWLLIRMKEKVGTALGSAAILADAACTRTCLQLSVVLFAASVGYQMTGFGWLDAVGAAVIGGLSVREGREAFDKAKGKSCSCSCK